LKKPLQKDSKVNSCWDRVLNKSDWIVYYASNPDRQDWIVLINQETGDCALYEEFWPLEGVKVEKIAEITNDFIKVKRGALISPKQMQTLLDAYKS